MNLLHLASRFVGSLWPLGPRSASTAWAHAALLEGEQALWNRMSAADRRHSIGVARRVVELLGKDRASREILAAALLHDVGKLESNLGTIRRVLATIAVGLAGRDAAAAWIETSGVTRRFGLYAGHPHIGADMLEMAGSDDLTHTWAREHHLPADQWTLDLDVATALCEADND
ncbi:MAG: HD domain-containing protein [Acidimicrobiales bacterium]